MEVLQQGQGNTSVGVKLQNISHLIGVSCLSIIHLIKRNSNFAQKELAQIIKNLSKKSFADFSS